MAHHGDDASLRGLRKDDQTREIFCSGSSVVAGLKGEVVTWHDAGVHAIIGTSIVPQVARVFYSCHNGHKYCVGIVRIGIGTT